MRKKGSALTLHLAVFLLSLVILQAQEHPLLDQNPSLLHWHQIKTPHFRIIYPEGFEKEAMRTANTLEYVYKPVSLTLQRQPRKIPVVLQNQTAVSNGFVTITPRHSQFFTTPPQDYTLLGNNDWLNLLSVHEFRHVVQYEKALTGFSKGIYWLFGNNGLGLVTITVPSWFWEGDAVGTETALTEGGRGRIPAFDLAFRTRLIAQKPFAYNKAYLRSYKHYVPNHYVLGYFMTTYVKRHYGPEAWGRILTRTYNLPFIPFRFSGAIKKETGLKVEKLYRKTVQELDSLWTGQVAELEETPVTALPTNQNRAFTNYQYPQYLTDGRIIAQKSGLADIEKFVVLDKNAGEKKVFVPGFISPNGMLSVANDRIVWTESGFDIRWGQRDYTVIKTFDVNTGEKQQLTRQTRLSAPAFSPDGNRIVAVQVTQKNEYSLVILNGQTGEEIQKLANPANDFYIMPRFTDDGGAVVAIKQNRQGKTIERINWQSGERKELIPYTSLNIGHAVPQGEYVFFNSPYNGIDNIYAVHQSTGQQYQVTDRKYGAYNPAFSPDGKEMAYNDFTPGGFRIVTMPNDSTLWRPLANVTNRTVAYYEPLINQEQGHNIMPEVPEKTYPVKPYRQWQHMFNPYSWGPVINSSGQELMAALSSQDLLSTTLINLGYGFDANQKTSSYFANVSYQRWFPVLDASFSTGLRRTTRDYNKDKVADKDSIETDYWRENLFSAGIRLPFNFTRSKYNERLTLSAHGSIAQVNGYDFRRQYVTEIGNGSLRDMRYRLQYTRILKMAPRDVNPRGGQTFSLYYRHTPFRTNFEGGIFTAQAGTFLPGIGKHHSLWLRGAYQREQVSPSPDRYFFPTTLLFPRGFSYRNFQNFLKGSVDYRFPILYPDLSLGRWFYIQRLKGNLFYDAGWGMIRNQSTYYHSVGLDLSVDFNFMRLLPQLEMGVRTYYHPQTGKFGAEFLVIDVGF